MLLQKKERKREYKFIGCLENSIMLFCMMQPPIIVPFSRRPSSVIIIFFLLLQRWVKRVVKNVA